MKGPEPLRPRLFPTVIPRQYKRINQGEAAFAEEHALMIFTELANAGQPLSKVLAAILLTGMHYAIELEKETNENTPTDAAPAQR